ncbi:MAG TPA: hypothetical protein PLK99_05365 [Burkholderiales bacterium]|nr:hypothetical protein [Burkholderiales bacterium]
MHTWGAAAWQVTVTFPLRFTVPAETSAASGLPGKNRRNPNSWLTSAVDLQLELQGEQPSEQPLLDIRSFEKSPFWMFEIDADHVLQLPDVAENVAASPVVCCVMVLGSIHPSGFPESVVLSSVSFT